jgi:Flp pilus assembly protein protease CpaA
MIFVTSGIELIISLGISLIIVIWLSACAVFDVRSHKVPNWLTVPAIPMALLAAWLTRESRDETMVEFLFHLVLIIFPLIIAWHHHLLGGADLKILLVLTVTNPLFVVAAWIGVMVYFLGLLILHHNRPIRFAGVPGFILGIGLFTFGQIGLMVARQLTIV